MKNVKARKQFVISVEEYILLIIAQPSDKFMNCPYNHFAKICHFQKVLTVEKEIQEQKPGHTMDENFCWNNKSAERYLHDKYRTGEHFR